MPLTFFTIGHSTRSVEALAGLLREAGADFIADVRTVPRSRANPQFNADVLPHSLTAEGIGYAHLPKLGGLRGRRKDMSASPNGFWENPSFRNYADYAATAPFLEGLSELREIGRSKRPAIMCAEAVWWRCHRRIIADYLLAGGDQVFHILGPNHVEPAALTPAARTTPEGALAYPAQAS